jgi:DNA-binding MarR family transcriptional regulator
VAALSPRRQQLQDEVLAEFRRIVARAFAQSKRSPGAPGLDFTHHMLLHGVLRNEAPTQGGIARAIGVTSGRVTGLIDDLEAKGVVRRVRSTSDRRKISVHITPLGRRLHEATHATMSHDMGQIFAGLDDAGLVTLRDLLQHIGPPGRDAPPIPGHGRHPNPRGQRKS